MTKYYDWEKREYVEPEREYESFEAVTDTTDWDGPSTSARELYIDQESGIVVSDIGKFERWIGDRT